LCWGRDVALQKENPGNPCLLRRPPNVVCAGEAVQNAPPNRGNSSAYRNLTPNKVVPCVLAICRWTAMNYTGQLRRLCQPPFCCTKDDLLYCSRLSIIKESRPNFFPPRITLDAAPIASLWESANVRSQLCFMEDLNSPLHSSRFAGYLWLAVCIFFPPVFIINAQSRPCPCPVHRFALMARGKAVFRSVSGFFRARQPRACNERRS